MKLFWSSTWSVSGSFWLCFVNVLVRGTQRLVYQYDCKVLCWIKFKRFILSQQQRVFQVIHQLVRLFIVVEWFTTLFWTAIKFVTNSKVLTAVVSCHVRSPSIVSSHNPQATIADGKDSTFSSEWTIRKSKKQLKSITCNEKRTQQFNSHFFKNHKR